MSEESSHIHIHIHADDARVSRQIDELIALIKQQGVVTMATMLDVQAKLAALKTDVESETDVATSVSTLLTGQNALLVDLRAQLTTALANNDPAAIQAVLDTLDQITATNAANKAATIAAVVANTPAGPIPDVQP